MMRLRVNPALLAPPFLGAMLQLNSVRQALTKNAKHAINQSSINQGDVTGIRLITPPISLQATFAEQIRRSRLLSRRRCRQNRDDGRKSIRRGVRSSTSEWERSCRWRLRLARSSRIRPPNQTARGGSMAAMFGAWFRRKVRHS
jgi:hypothetical protein